MFIGNLLDPRSGVAIETTYYRSNTTQTLPPTSPAGNLAKGEPLGWQWDDLCGSGLDIHLKLTPPQDPAIDPDKQTPSQGRIWICQLILHCYITASASAMSAMLITIQCHFYKQTFKAWTAVQSVDIFFYHVQVDLFLLYWYIGIFICHKAISSDPY